MRAFRRVVVPRTGSPVIRRLFEVMNEQRLTVADLAERAGFAERTPRSWRTESSATLVNIEAALHVLGYELAVVRKREELADAAD